MKSLGLLFAQVAFVSSAFAAAPTQWHAKCQVDGSPEKEITVTEAEPAVVFETKDYVYSVELRYSSLTLRADATNDKVDKNDVVNYSYIRYKNELPSMMILTSKVANVFSCTEVE